MIKKVIIMVLACLGIMFPDMMKAQNESNELFFDGMTSLVANTEYLSTDDIVIKAKGDASIYKEQSLSIFGKNLTCRVKLSENNNTSDATQFNIKALNDGILLVYFIRPWDYMKNPGASDAYDVKLVSNNSSIGGVSEYGLLLGENKMYRCGIKYYRLTKGLIYTLSSTNASDLCRLYGLIFMPGNVAAYNVKGNGNLDLIGKYCSNTITELPEMEDGDCHFLGWYHDKTYTTPANVGDNITQPSLLYAKWRRNIWDMSKIWKMYNLGTGTIDFDGMVIHGNGTSTIDNCGLMLLVNNNDQDNKSYVEFKPEVDGELFVVYAASNENSNTDRTIAISTGANNLVVGQTNQESGKGKNQKEISVKLEAGTTYKIHANNAQGLYIYQLRYVENSVAAKVEDNKVILFTTKNIAGWRPFYDAEKTYKVDDNTTAYVAQLSGSDVVLRNLTGKYVPAKCPVLLNTTNQLLDGSYQIILTESSDEESSDEQTYSGENLLTVSAQNETVEAYRLGYNPGDGVAFFAWSTQSSDAGIVYLKLSQASSSQAKVNFIVDETTTSVHSLNVADNNNAVMYSLMGQRVPSNYKGIVIINGMKYNKK